MYRIATRTTDGVRWTLRRNCSVSPGQLGGMWLLLCCFSLVVAGFFWSLGVWMVPVFTALELMAVSVAFLMYARHATDGETISLCNGRLIVEREESGRLHRTELAGRGLSVEAPSDLEPLVAVRGSGQAVQVGRFVRSDLRPVLARELVLALRGL